MRSCNILIDGNVLKEKARIFSEKMDVEIDFKVSNGWFRSSRKVTDSVLKSFAVRVWKSMLQQSMNGGKNN